MNPTLRRFLPVVISLALFIAALEVLRGELRTVSLARLVDDIRAVPVSRLVFAFGLTAANYLALTGYDFLAFASIGRKLPARRIASVSLVSYAVSNNIGFAMLTGASIRYRFYTRWGIGVSELSRIVVSYTVTFWLGLFALGGLSLALGFVRDLPGVEGQIWPAAVGWLLLGTVAAYLIACAIHARPVVFKRFTLDVPVVRIGLAQLVVSTIEWGLAGSVLYVLLPPDAVPFPAFLASFFAAILLGMASHVPGGLGVFDSVLAWLLAPLLPIEQLVPALLVYRAIYYLIPLVCALVALLADEALRRRAHATRIGAMVGRVTERITPRVLAVFTFLAGAVLLFSGATPAAPGRLEWVATWLPLGVIEVSHFEGSVVGAMLLVLSQGLSRRLDAAYYLTCGSLAAGIVASLLKGFDYEEATLLALLLAALVRSRPAFRRRAAFFATRLSAAWGATVVAAVCASIWLGFFAFKHVEYTHQLWWQFELRGDASRFLRASVGASIVVLVFGFVRLVRPAPHEVETPDSEQLGAAERIIASQSATQPNLALLGDKGLLFNEDRTAFVMYGVQGRTWVAMGDPVGPPEAVPKMISQFLERCHDFGGVPAFYEASTAFLHRYADLGLTFIKIGEEARVDLQTFTWFGASGARCRQALRRLQKVDASFRILDRDEARSRLEELRSVSDAWRTAKSGAEKGFSLGFFDDAYLARFPVAIIERNGRIEAFANLWTSDDGVEMSIDLMRHRPDAPRDLMETLIVHLIQWGQAHRYRWLVLGMAPLSGFQPSPMTSLWTKVGAFLYRHGEPVFNFQGLRAFKEKFNPVWQPRYVVYPGGMTLPRVLADISALVAGGYRQIFLR